MFCYAKQTKASSKRTAALQAALSTFSSGFLAPPAHVGSHEEAAPAPEPACPPDPFSPPPPNRPPKVPACCLEGLPACLDGLTASSAEQQHSITPKRVCTHTQCEMIAAALLTHRRPYSKVYILRVQMYEGVIRSDETRGHPEAAIVAREQHVYLELQRMLLWIPFNTMHYGDM